jgi:hypothetical protein
MRSIKLLCATALLAIPLAAGSAERAYSDGVSKTYHARMHRHYYPREHYGYYWYQWGWRTGGTRRSWTGSTFRWASPQPFIGWWY